MSRNIFLSFRPEFFRPILYNIKKYEYRKRFLKEEVNDKRFKVPRCYFNLENFPKTFDFLKRQKTLTTEFVNDHSGIFDDNLGMTCAKMELTNEFQEKDKKYTNNNKYIHVKSGYMNKENLKNLLEIIQ